MFIPPLEILQDRLMVDLFQPGSLPFSLIFRFRSIRDEGYHIEDLFHRLGIANYQSAVLEET
jgi:hypothetical protein